MKFTKTQKISASMLGSDERLSIIGAFQIIQNSVTEFMGELKIDGMTVKQKYNAFWVFVKTRIKFFNRLLWGDEYTVTAFISSMSVAKMYIDVKVSNKVGETAFYARVELCVLDIATQKIKKITTVGVDKYMLTEEETIDISFAKFDDFDINGLSLVEQVKIRSTNIDYSHHTNNLEYLRFLMNTYSVEEMEAKTVKEIEVVYASQSYENDVLDVLKTGKADREFLVLQKGGKPVIKCEIAFY